MKLPAIIFEDNEPVVRMTTTTFMGLRKCKHFQILTAYIKEQVEEGLVQVNWIETRENTADILSKVGVTGADFQYKASNLLGKHPRASDEEYPPTNDEDTHNSNK